ncbi:MAG TPA: hypothetical protein VKA85_00970 [Candidatus Limnocylindrales bacterium]|nr:hypothetical protein [Candidatus Limnocylindrales bacterium]
MNSNPRTQLWLANERLARLRRDASNDRLATAIQTPIRRSIGNSIIRIGELVAAEPNLRPARVP